MTVADLLHLAFGAVAGLTLVAMLLLARQSVGVRGPLPSLASLAGALLALLLLLVAASQIEPVLRGVEAAEARKAADAATAKTAAEAIPVAKAAALATLSARLSHDGARGASGTGADGLSVPIPDPKSLLPTLLAFISSITFLGAVVGAVAAALLAWVTRDDVSGEESPEAHPLAALMAKPAA